MYACWRLAQQGFEELHAFWLSQFLNRHPPGATFGDGEHHAFERRATLNSSPMPGHRNTRHIEQLIHYAFAEWQHQNLQVFALNRGRFLSSAARATPNRRKRIQSAIRKRPELQRLEQCDRFSHLYLRRMKVIERHTRNITN